MAVSPPTLEQLELELLGKTPILLHDIKRKLYEDHRFEGVYLIYCGAELVKVGKTSGRAKKKERKMADRICGLSFSDSVLRKEGMSLTQAHACTVKSLAVEDSLLRGLLECHMMAKYSPRVNHAELRR